MLLPMLLAVALSVYALVDVWGTPQEQVLRLPKPTWVIVVVAIPVFGPVAWLIAGKSVSSARESSGTALAPDVPPPGSAPPVRVAVPDVLPDVGLDPDDPEDRWLIEQRDRQRAEQAEQQGPVGGTDRGGAEPGSAPRPSERTETPRPPDPRGRRQEPPHPRPPMPRRPTSRPPGSPANRSHPAEPPGVGPEPSPRDAEPPSPTSGP